MKIKWTLVNLFVLASGLFSLNSYANENPESTGFYYPNHSCQQKPVRPEKTGDVKDYKNIVQYNNAVAKYNIKVTEYNKRIKAYKVCINQYIQDGNQNIAIIREKLNKALKEARAK